MLADPTVQVAVIGVFATSITTAGVVLVALISNRRPTPQSSDAVEKALRERIAVLEVANSALQYEIDRKVATIDVLREQLRASRRRK